MSSFVGRGQPRTAAGAPRALRRMKFGRLLASAATTSDHAAAFLRYKDLKKQISKHSSAPVSERVNIFAALLQAEVTRLNSFLDMVVTQLEHELAALDCAPDASPPAVLATVLALAIFQQRHQGSAHRKPGPI